MAETLGSLVDKMTIKCIREVKMQEMVEAGGGKFSVDELKERLSLLDQQKAEMRDEIDQFIADSFAAGKTTRDEKIKLYNKRDQMDQIGQLTKVSEAIEGLAKKNFELWNLEDEARREDVELSYIGEVKRKIDFANQQRNDFIDKIDALFAQEVSKHSAK